MLLDHLARYGLLFLGGKGGVGKTTTSSMLALALADRGRRVCLVSTDPAHNLGHLFERPVGAEPVAITERLSAIELDPEASISAHLAQVGRFLQSVAPRGGQAEITRHLERSRHSPGMAEAALLERLATLAEGIGNDYDHLVLDTAPTGHTLMLLSLPEMMAAWTDGLIANRVEADRFAARARALTGGREAQDPRAGAIHAALHQRRDRFARLRARITDPAQTSFIAVTTPERMPVLETLALGRALQSGGIPLGGIVVNRIPDSWTSGQLQSRIAPLRDNWPETPLWSVPQSAEEPSGLAGLRALPAMIGTIGA